ncbi:MAG: DUF3006 domain-containing protein [Myxococcaceae bacterium]
MPFAVIDRFEEDQAVLLADDGERVVARASLPPGAREGEVIDLETWRVDPGETERRREEIQETRERAFKGKKPPDFDL